MNFKSILLSCLLLIVSGCSSASNLIGNKKLETPPEFKQKILLEVDDSYQMHQAPRSRYDVGDLQSFHSQHTLPVLIEDAFKDMFGEVEMVQKGPQIETERPDVPAIFEVKLLDVANDNYFESADTYRGEVTLAVAMKSPRGNVFWMQGFRGSGFVRVDPQYSTGLGPQDALVDAMRDAINQMQDAIVKAPEVRLQMKHYSAIDKARQEKESGI